MENKNDYRVDCDNLEDIVAGKYNVKVSTESGSNLPTWTAVKAEVQYLNKSGVIVIDVANRTFVTNISNIRLQLEPKEKGLNDAVFKKNDGIKKKKSKKTNRVQ